MPGGAAAAFGPDLPLIFLRNAAVRSIERDIRCDCKILSQANW